MQLLKEKPTLWPYILQTNDGEEVEDAPTNQSEVEEGDGEEEKTGSEIRGTREKAAVADGYRIGLRNPQFCRAESSCLWELKEVLCVCG